MERQNGNIATYKSKENGIKAKPPYSVETPYGFRIDLDFLKYVDDIEKGNTIKRVPMQRRSKVPRASTLPRHLNPSGSGHRPNQWGSTGALGPRSRQSDAHHQGYSSWACDGRRPLSPAGLSSLSEMEARIKEFDEQPLGEHIRPHLLRASSLPLTVLLRQSSESTEDAGSLRGSRDRLGCGRNASCEDICESPDSARSRDCSGLVRRLAEALERVGELEMEVRVVPELRAQICFLQEEKERLRLGLSQRAHAPAVNGSADPSRLCSHFGTRDVKRPRHEGRGAAPGDDADAEHEWRTSTDLDELLTVTSLQAKVAALEQKLHESGLELRRALALLREQQDESRRKDQKMDNLLANPGGVWVRAERVLVEQDGEETAAVGHVRKIKRLLDEQWACLCADRKRDDPKVNALQREMMGLVDVLSSHYTRRGQHGAAESIMKTDGCAQTQTNQHCGAFNDGPETTTRSGALPPKESSGPGRVRGVWEQKEMSSSPTDMAAAQVDADPGRKGGTEERRPSPDAQMISRGGRGSGPTDGGGASADAQAEAAEKTAKTKAKPPGEQMEPCSGSESTPGARESVSADFTAACQFLHDHMENMDNPNDDMRKALVVLFQHWFGAAAEEGSEASRVAAHLREVKKSTPALLAFLINLADDNGNTVLHYSVSHCNDAIVSLLLDTGVSDMNLQNNAGYTAVMLAALTAPDSPGAMEVVRKIMETGNVNIRSNQTGQTALHLAVRHGRVVMVRLLLSCGADTNIQDSQGTTALMFASERGHTHIARLLLERSQCDLTLTDKRGQTAISIAMQGSHTDTAALLQAHAKARHL